MLITRSRSSALRVLFARQQDCWTSPASKWHANFSGRQAHGVRPSGPSQAILMADPRRGHDRSGPTLWMNRDHIDARSPVCCYSQHSCYMRTLCNSQNIFALSTSSRTDPCVSAPTCCFLGLSIPGAAEGASMLMQA